MLYFSQHPRREFSTPWGVGSDAGKRCRPGKVFTAAGETNANHVDGRDLRTANRDGDESHHPVVEDNAADVSDSGIGVSGSGVDVSGSEVDGLDPVSTGASGGGSRVSEESAVQSYTVRLELVDEPGELLRALEPIAERGGNLLSIFHERGNVTPRGHIPVEVDIECTPARFDDVVDALREAGINVIQAGQERYSEEVTLLLVGHLVDTDLSDTLDRIQGCNGTSVVDFSLSAPEGTDEVASARLRLAAETDSVETALSTVRSVADEKDLKVVEPLTPGAGADGKTEGSP